MRNKIFILDPASLSTYFTYCFVKSLADKGLDIRLFTTKFLYEPVDPPGNVYTSYLFFKLSNILYSYVKSPILRKLLRAIEYPFDLAYLYVLIIISRVKSVHYIWPVIPVLDLLFIKALKLAGVNVIYTAHNPLPHEQKAWDRLQYSALYRSADRIIALTEYVKKSVLSTSGIEKNKIVVIPHGDFDFIVSASSPNVKLLGELTEYTDGYFVIGFFGLIRPYKGLEYLLRAFSEIVRTPIRAKLLVAGKCYQDPDFYISLARELDITDSVRFDFRYAPLPDLLSYLNVTDTVVLPYVEASQSGNTVMLYKMGIPVIATNVGGLGEMIIDGSTGILVPPRDSQAIAGALVSLIEDRELYRQLSENGMKLARERYDWDNIASATIDVEKSV